MALGGTYNEEWVENYLEFVYELQSAGVKLSIGSDCHSARLSGKSYEAAEKLLTKKIFKQRIFFHFKSLLNNNFFCKKLNFFVYPIEIIKNIRYNINI